MYESKGKRFPIDVILECIRWYAASPLSYQDLEEMMQERVVFVERSPNNRPVVRIFALLKNVFRNQKRPIGQSWRMDEIYIEVKGVCKYLYRTVDKEDKTVEFLLTAKRDKAAAKRSSTRPCQLTESL